MRKQPKDSQWPPLGVRDLKPDAPAKPETVKINSLGDKLKKIIKP